MRHQTLLAAATIAGATLCVYGLQAGDREKPVRVIPSGGGTGPYQLIEIRQDTVSPANIQYPEGADTWLPIGDVAMGHDPLELQLSLPVEALVVVRLQLSAFALCNADLAFEVDGALADTTIYAGNLQGESIRAHRKRSS